MKINWIPGLLYSIVLCLILSSTSVTAQVSKESYEEAELYLENERYHKALELYTALLKEEPNNANLNFKVGFCYLQTATMKTKAISFLEFAVKHISEEYDQIDYKEKSAPLESQFFLGKAYHVNYRFNDAKRVYAELRSKLGEDEEELLSLIKREEEICNNAIELVSDPVEMEVTNLGKNVNSEFDEHSPVISGDESLLIYTSKREGNTGSNELDDGQKYEDIYISTYTENGFSKGKKISGEINTSKHDASIALSFDGTKLFIYRSDEGGGNIYMSERTGTEWGTPKMLPSVVNSKYRETHASISLDGNDIYFSSDRKGGYGGLDIYRVRKLPNGQWSKAQNLGPVINSEYDEEGAYFHPDGVSLFFASKGHKTMGGFDVFVSTVNEDDQWTKPENVGYPINTPDDNIYYIPSVDGRRAYYASYDNNSIGKYDLFRIDLSESHVRNQTVIAGIAMTKSGKMLENAFVTITDMDDEVVGIYTPDAETGKFLIILPKGKEFYATIESENHRELQYKMSVPGNSYDQSRKVVIFNDIVTLLNKQEEEKQEVVSENSDLSDSEEGTESEIESDVSQSGSASGVVAQDVDNGNDSFVAAAPELSESTEENALTDNSEQVNSESSELQNQSEADDDGLVSSEDKDLEEMVGTLITEDMINDVLDSTDVEGEGVADSRKTGSGEKIKGISNSVKEKWYLYALALLVLILIARIRKKKQQS